MRICSSLEGNIRISSRLDGDMGILSSRRKHKDLLLSGREHGNSSYLEGTREFVLSGRDTGIFSSL